MTNDLQSEFSILSSFALVIGAWSLVIQSTSPIALLRMGDLVPRRSRASSYLLLTRRAVSGVAVAATVPESSSTCSTAVATGWSAHVLVHVVPGLSVTSTVMNVLLLDKRAA